MAGKVNYGPEAAALVAAYRGALQEEEASGFSGLRGANATGAVFRENHHFQTDLAFAREVIHQYSAAYRFASEATHADEATTRLAFRANPTLLQYASDTLLGNARFMLSLESERPGTIATEISNLDNRAINPALSARLRQILNDLEYARLPRSQKVKRSLVHSGAVIMHHVMNHKAAIVKGLACAALLGLGYLLGSRK